LLFVEAFADSNLNKLKAWLRPFASRTREVAYRLVAVVATIAAITLFCTRLVPVNAPTGGFAYLLAILVIATRWGFLEATVASFVAVLCFNFFFFPPVGTFNVADPENWVALFAFLATSIIASQLSARAKQRTQEALDRQKEMERLYALSRAILLTDTSQAPAKQIALRIQEIFEFPALALYDGSTGEVHRAGPEDLSGHDDMLKQAASRGILLTDEANRITVIPVRLGGHVIGSLAVRGGASSPTALQALSNLVAIALEKVRGQEAANRAEAARQSEELKSTLLDSIAHEFKTPLTSIKAAATALLSTPTPSREEQRELLTVVDEEADRLGRLVTEAIQMARIEAGKIKLNTALRSVEGLIHRILQQMKPIVEGRNVTVSIAGDLPQIIADQELMGLAIRQLLDNAVKYSPQGSPIAVRAEKGDGCVIISVGDQGPGIPEREQLRIFQKFYRSSDTHQHVTGSGMGLTIAREIVRAHGGDIWVRSRAGQGSEFCISVPAAGEASPA
jgi:two-component system sensor histidine kinase KdpD